MKVHHVQRRVQAPGRVAHRRGVVGQECPVHPRAQHAGRDPEGQQGDEGHDADGPPQQHASPPPAHSGTDIVPRLTKTAEPPTRTAVVAPPDRSASTWIVEGRPISSPCSTVHRSEPASLPSAFDR